MKLHHLSVAVVVAAATVAGCGGSSSTPSDASTAAPAKTAAAAKPASSAGGSVTIANFKFSPASLTAKSGARVTVTNNDTTAHTATADDGSSFDSGDIDPGSAKTITVSKPGTYKYHCSIHPFMHGTLVVS